MQKKSKSKKAKMPKNPGVLGMMNQGIPFVKEQPAVDRSVSTNPMGGKRNMHGIGY